MKTTYKIILGLMLLLFVACGGGNTNTTPSNNSDTPKSPVLENKEKTPPSIPVI